MHEAVVVGQVNAGKSLLVVNFAAFCAESAGRLKVAESAAAPRTTRWSVERARQGWVSAGPHTTLTIQGVLLDVRMGAQTLRLQLWDTPGLIDGVADRPDVRQAMAGALTQLAAAQLVLHVADVSRPEVWTETDRELALLAQARSAYILLANKMDHRSARAGLMQLRQETSSLAARRPEAPVPDIIPVSALTRQGFSALRRAILTRLNPS